MSKLFTLEEVHALELSAAKAAEERIIQLLENIDPQTFGCPHFEEHTKMAMWDVIALIKVTSLFKGENK
jgi:hypothetical protein